MATTANKIEKALNLLNNQDWYWCMSDSNSAYGYARSNMRAFVELVATITNCTIVKALRALWIARYEYVRATMWNSNNEAKETFKAKESELMGIIKMAA